MQVRSSHFSGRRRPSLVRTISAGSETCTMTASTALQVTSGDVTALQTHERCSCGQHSNLSGLLFAIHTAEKGRFRDIACNMEGSLPIQFCGILRLHLLRETLLDGQLADL